MRDLLKASCLICGAIAVPSHTLMTGLAWPIPLDMPLVRYRIGDLVRPAPQPFYSAYELHGRVADALATEHGAN